MMPPILEVIGLSVRFGGLMAIDNVTFEMHDGELVSLIGPNGAGKTSVFNAITGYLRPQAGSILYKGSRLSGLPPHAIAARGVVRTFQKTSLFGGQTTFNNMLTGLHLSARQRLPAIILGLPVVTGDERKLKDSAWDILRFIGLDSRADELGSALSYGEQRLLEVAIALAARPKLLLLDEPVSGMNPAEKARFLGTLDKIRREGTAILLVEHDMRTVMGASDRIICLNHGRIIADGAPDEIRSHPEVIRAYLGERAARAGG
jgi:branched-chain amino acid transport system ATP-binding protein